LASDFCAAGPAIKYEVFTNSNVAAHQHFGQNAVVTLTPKIEQFVWIVCTCAAGIAFLTSHTFYVTAGTFVSGAVFLGITAFLFWMRFRRRQTPRTKGLTVTSNTALALLSLVAVLYLLGVATWYE
jgi:hypothetical protein